VLWYCWLGIMRSNWSVKTGWWGVGVVICLKQGVHCLHMVLLMPQHSTLVLPFWYRAYPGCPEKEAIKRVVVVPPPHTHTCLTTLFPGLPRWAGTRKVKPMWIILKQETASGSGISWAICMSATRSRQITTPAPHHSVFYKPDALPVAQPTVSKHWKK